MSIKLLTYSGIITKVKCMQHHLLSEENLFSISQLNSTADFVLFLKNQPAYHTFFSSVDEHTIHRGQIENLFIHSLYENFTSIYRFANKKQRNILTIIQLRFEINILKCCLQQILYSEQSYHLYKLAAFFNHYSGLHMEQLIACNTIEQFITLLKETRYYPILFPLQSKENCTLFDYEMQLDIYYFQRIWKLKEKFTKRKEKLLLTSIYGTTIDLLNIMWIYRIKKYYKIESPTIYRYIIPIYYKLQKDQISKLMHSCTLDEYKTLLSETYYGKRFPNLAGDSLEQFYNNTIYKVYNQSQRKAPISIIPIFLFLFLKEQEIEHLTTILERICYGIKVGGVLFD